MGHGLSTDTFFNGRLRIDQPRSGYRFSIDAVLLAAATGQLGDEKVLDLGTGCGIIPLLLAFRFPRIRIQAVEIQPALADIALRNVAANHMQDRIRIHCADLCQVSGSIFEGGADLVVANPPYRPADSGRINPDAQRAIARHEIRMHLADLVSALKRCSRTGGRVVLIYPAERLVALFTQMREAGVEPKRLRPVQSTTGAEARLVLVEGRNGGRPGLKVASPLTIYTPDGDYTEEVALMMAP